MPMKKALHRQGGQKRTPCLHLGHLLRSKPLYLLASSPLTSYRFVFILRHRRKSPLAPLSDVKGLTNALPPLGASSVDSVIPAKHSPLSKHASSSRALSNDELSHDSLSSKRRYDHLEDSFEQSVDEKLEESKDGFEVSDSFENSDFNTSVKLDSPLSKQSSHVLAPLGDVLSPYSAKSDREDKSFALDDSQPEELASASFLEESEVSDTSNMFDNEDCVVLDEPKKSDSGPSETSREREKQYSPGGPATEELEGGNVNLSTASTVHLMRSQVGWGQDDDKGRPGDDFQYKEAGDAGRDNMDEGFPGRNRRSGGDGVRTHQSAQNESKVDSFDENSDFDSIEDIDQYDDEADDKGVDLNVSYRSNQEEDEEENKRLNASREDERNKQANDASNNASSGSLFSRSDNKKKEDDVPLKVDKSLNETDDYEDDYGDDFDDDDFEKEDEGEGAQLDESIAESIAESLEEDFDDDDNLSFGSNGDDSDKEKSYMSSPSHSPSGKLPSLFSKTNPPLQEHKTDHSFDDSHDSDDPFQDKSASFDEDGPETSLVSKDDLEDFSVGEESSSGDEFLKDEDDESNSHNNLSVVKGSVGRLGESNEFSMSENEISGSHNLNEFGVDYTTSAAPPPAGRRGGW